MDKFEAQFDPIPESAAARWAYHLALVPILGFFLYMFTAFFALWRIGQGRTGFFWLRKGFWRMLRMTSIGLVALAAGWFCPYWVNEVPNEWIYSKGYAIRSFSYPPKPLKMWQWTSYYNNGKIESQGEYRLDEKVGKWRVYAPLGTLDTEEIHTLGNKIYQVSAYSDGKIRVVGKTDGFAYCGKWSYYSSSNELEREELFDEEGHYVKTTEYKNGQISKVETVKDESKHLISIYIDVNGWRRYEWDEIWRVGRDAAVTTWTSEIEMNVPPRRTPITK